MDITSYVNRPPCVFVATTYVVAPYDTEAVSRVSYGETTTRRVD